MGIQVVWDNTEHTILRYDVRGQWTLRDLANAREQVTALLSDNQGPVAIIADVRGSQFVPTNLLGRFSQSSYTPLPNVDLMIFVGASNFIRNMMDMFDRMYQRRHSRMQFTADLETARSQIDANRRGFPVQPASPLPN